MTRRQMLRSAAGLLAAGNGALLRGGPASNPCGGLPGPLRFPLRETASGWIRGSERDGICAFFGVPYGAPTSGSGRFRPATRPQAWTGVRSALAYGPMCPQASSVAYPPDDETKFLLSPHLDAQEEDCLRLNIWAPTTGQGLPVVVSIHGGGCAGWSGQYLPAYAGGNMSRGGDVVVVALTHRIGVLGFLNLGALDQRYGTAGNVGLLDLVSALGWIRENIAVFGGDPGNVTLIGQSGGGAKIISLLEMPAAEGLFHRAVVASTVGGVIQSEAASARMAAAVLEELNLGPGKIEQLHSVPIESLIDASERAKMRLNAERSALARAGRALAPSPEWGPVVEGRVLPRRPFATDAPPLARDVPLIIGSVLNECLPNFFNPTAERMNWTDLAGRLSRRFGSGAPDLLEAYRSAYPKSKPVELLSIIESTHVRATVVDWAEKKASQKGAPAYLYWFTWHSPVLGGRPRSFHCLDLPFIFGNAERCWQMTGGTPEAAQLEKAVCGAIIAFARSANPNGPALPRWPVFSADSGAVMIYDRVPGMAEDPDKSLRKVYAEAERTSLPGRI